MTRTKDKIVDAMNAPNQHAIDLKEEIDSQTRTWEWRLIAAQAAMARVVKDSRVAFGNQRYAYTSAEDMIGACREALLGAGLALTRSWDIMRTEYGPVVLSRFRLHHTNGTVEMGVCPFPLVGQSGKGEDKAVATALTSSLGYFLRDLLMVPKEDDSQQMVKAPEMDARDDRTVTKPEERIGLEGAASLRQRVQVTGATLAQLHSAMVKAGVPLPSPEVHTWPISLMPRIEKWITAQAAKPVA
jgi:hypothetical protein